MFHDVPPPYLATAAVRKMLATGRPDPVAIASILRANPQASQEIFLLLKRTVPYETALRVLSLATSGDDPAEAGEVSVDTLEDLPLDSDPTDVDVELNPRSGA